MQQEITQLDNYITNLYASHSTYVPAILAASFHDYIYLGDLSEATNKLFSVQRLVDSDADRFEEDFRQYLEGRLSILNELIVWHASQGRTSAMLQSNASPQLVRNTWGTTILPSILILQYAPSTNTVSPP
jgi:hypothetical protein